LHIANIEFVRRCCYSSEWITATVSWLVTTQHDGTC